MFVDGLFRQDAVVDTGRRGAAVVHGSAVRYGKKGGACRATERDRIPMKIRQPKSMQNYTYLGFKKIKSPAAVFKLIQEFWEANKDRPDKKDFSE